MADRREILEKAWETASTEVEEKVEEPVKAEAAAEPEVKIDEPEVKESTPKEEPETTSAKQSADPYTQEEKAAKARESAASTPQFTDKPPASWKPAQREQWAKLPSDVRLEINRREREIQEGIKQTEGIRRFANEFAQVIQPYSHMIAAAGSTPMRAVKSLMDTAGGLTNGSQEQKAQIIANIIGQYGVDIATLDKVLSGVVKDGRVQPRAPAAEQPPQWARPMFEFMQTVQQRQQAAQIEAEAEAQAAVQSFAEKPFFEDLREEMADIMELAAKRGVSMTLEQAYNRAVQQNEEISTIIKQREKAAAARNPVSEAAATLARARRAASTVSGGPSGEPEHKVTHKSRREAIEAAWEAAGGR